jgi:hypothetical protein
MDEHQHVALPKLYGAPAYARPPRPVEEQDRPFDPDDLPLEAFRTTEDEVLAATLPGPDAGIVPGVPAPATTAPADHLAAPPAPVAPPPAAGAATEPDPSGVLQPRPFSLKALARRIGGR